MSPIRSISACVITKNEEENLPACLASLAFSAEILVVDCGSTDSTVHIARRHGARVIQTDWPGMIAQKNRAIDAATHDWVLSIDADERVSDTLRASIERALVVGPGEPTFAGYEMAWETVFLGGPVHSDAGRARWKLRLFDRRRGRWEGQEPHGHVRVDGDLVRLDGPLLHRTVRDLQHQVEKINAYTDAAAPELLRLGRSSLFGLFVRPPAAFVRTYLLRGGFRDGARGLVLAIQTAAYVFLKNAKLWELQRPSRRGGGDDDESSSG